MEFLEQILKNAGYLTTGNLLDDAEVRKCGLIRDKKGRAIARLETAANGVDIIVTDYSTHKVLGKVYL